MSLSVVFRHLPKMYPTKTQSLKRTYQVLLATPKDPMLLDCHWGHAWLWVREHSVWPFPLWSDAGLARSACRWVEMSPLAQRGVKSRFDSSPLVCMGRAPASRRSAGEAAERSVLSHTVRCVFGGSLATWYPWGSLKVFKLCLASLLYDVGTCIRCTQLRPDPYIPPCVPSQQDRWTLSSCFVPQWLVLILSSLQHQWGVAINKIRAG